LEDANLRQIAKMRGQHGFANVGYSDHTIGHEAAVMAVALGAVMIEKHLTLSREDGGPDDHFATEPHEFAAMVDAVHAAWQAMREPEGKTGEEAHQPLRPSIWAIKDIAAGEPFTLENVRVIRPSGGLPPTVMWKLSLRHAIRPIARGTPLTWEMAS
jgi:N-acetylneuraminate synthase